MIHTFVIVQEFLKKRYKFLKTKTNHYTQIYLSVFSSPSNTLKPTLFIHQQAPELRKETSLLFFGHLNQHFQAFHTDPPG